MSGVDVLVATLRSFGEQAANGGVAFKDLTKTLLPLMEVIFPYTRSHARLRYEWSPQPTHAAEQQVAHVPFVRQ